MGRKKKILAGLLTALAASAVFVRAEAAAGEFDQIDAAKAKYQEADDPQPFVAYVYIESDKENPYNDEYRGISVNFGGDMDLYVFSEHYNYHNDWVYDAYHVIRFTGELPKNSQSAYHISPRASDMNGLIFSHMEWFFDEDVSGMKDVRLQDGYNEFFLVGGTDD